MKRIGKIFTESTASVRVCLMLLAVVLFIVLFADEIAPYDPDATDLLCRNAAPVFLGGTAEHLLGTDELGRDLLSRLFYGTRISVGMALFGLLFGGLAGTILGLTAGYFEGIWDRIVMTFVNFQQSVPYILIVLLAIVLFGRGIPVLMIFIGLAKWESYAKLIRGIVMSVRKKQYVEAARTYNASPARILFRYIFPSVRTSLMVLLTLNFPSVLLIESSLSFMGIGVQPPTSTLGQMVEDGRNYLMVAPWIALVPAVMIVLVSCCIQHIGEYLRDCFDVRLTED